MLESRRLQCHLVGRGVLHPRGLLGPVSKIGISHSQLQES